MEEATFERVYASVVNKETTYDGIYYTGVRTTRIVCRPSCRAKTPKRENVTFYRSVADAVHDGFRPCKRCKPDAPGANGPDAALAAEIDRLLAARYPEPWTLAKLAEALMVSPYHLQRVYKRVRGHSPQDELHRVRVEAAKCRLLDLDRSIHAVTVEIGLKGPSHFTAWFRKQTGLTPADYRRQSQESSGRTEGNESADMGEFASRWVHDDIERNTGKEELS